MRAILVLSTIGIVSIPPAAGAQSLADVARQEEQRRKSVAESGRVYTNEDLPEPLARPAAAEPSAAAPRQAAASEAAGAQAPAKAAEDAEEKTSSTVLKPREKRNEEHWRGRAGQFRSRLAKLNEDVTALQAFLENVRSQPQTSATAADIRQAEADLARFAAERKSIDDDRMQFEQRARDEKVPAEWIQ